MSKYAIWNKTDEIYTPAGERLTAEEWIDRYSWINHPSAVPVVASGLINGAFSGELTQMVEMYTANGADFSSCTTSEEILAAIEEFENTPRDSGTVSSEELTATSLASIAASMEYQNLLTLEDAEEDVETAEPETGEDTDTAESAENTEGNVEAAEPETEEGTEEETETVETTEPETTETTEEG